MTNEQFHLDVRLDNTSSESNVQSEEDVISSHIDLNLGRTIFLEESAIPRGVDCGNATQPAISYSKLSVQGLAKQLHIFID